MEQTATPDGAVSVAEQNQPAAEPNAANDDATANEGLLDLEGEEQQAPEVDPDELEDEIDGVKVKGKKDLIEKLRNERLMREDHTRKTQELAEHRRAVAQQWELATKFQEEHLNLRLVERELAEFQKVDWDRFIAENPEAAQRANLRLTLLNQQREQLQRTLSDKQQQAALYAQRETAKRIQEGQEALRREIKDWSPERAEKLVKFGLERGFGEQELRGVMSPAIVRLLNDAYTLDQLRKNAAKKSTPAQPRPATSITAQSATAQRDPDKMSVDDWMKQRESQVKRTSRRA